MRFAGVANGTAFTLPNGGCLRRRYGTRPSVCLKKMSIIGIRGIIHLIKKNYFTLGPSVTLSNIIPLDVRFAGVANGTAFAL